MTRPGIFKIGVTGGAGSGKTSVCNLLRELGFIVVSSDELARKAVAPGTPAHESIVAHFGPGVLLPDGRINRSELRRKIVDSDAARSELERLIHPQIARLVKLEMDRARHAGARLVFVEVPLLFELGMQGQFDAVVLVSADRGVRVGRLMARDNVAEKEAEKLIDVQMPEKDKIDRSDFVIRNNGSREQLKKMVDRFHKKLIENVQKSVENP